MFSGWLSKYPSEIVCSLIVFILTCPAGVLITKWLSDKTPDIIVRQYYNSFDTASTVPKKVGELALDYKEEKPTNKLPYYLVTVQNEGNGAEENLSVQITFVPAFPSSFYKEPDLKVFSPRETTFVDGIFFTELEKFPVDALAEVSFVPPEKIKTLCNVDIKIAGKAKMGKVEKIRGVECN